jgi:hypothetical protein
MNPLGEFALNRRLVKAMRRFSLVKGAGDGTISACVMSAAGWLIGQSGWNDHPLTVDGTIRLHLVAVNDLVSDEDRKLLWPYAKKALYTEWSTPLITEEQQQLYNIKVRAAICNKAYKKFIQEYVYSKSRCVTFYAVGNTAALKDFLKSMDDAIAIHRVKPT